MKKEIRNMFNLIMANYYLNRRMSLDDKKLKMIEKINRKRKITLEKATKHAKNAGWENGEFKKMEG